MDERIAILYPVAALAVLTFLVAAAMYRQRIGEMRRRRIHPQSVALSAGRAERLQATNAADNYNNLFELPVLFYVLCLCLYLTDRTGAPYLWAAWLFVALRVVHSAIQCTYNRVVHRFGVFVAGMVVLAATWLGFVVDLLAG